MKILIKIASIRNNFYVKIKEHESKSSENGAKIAFLEQLRKMCRKIFFGAPEKSYEVNFSNT